MRFVLRALKLPKPATQTRKTRTSLPGTKNQGADEVPWRKPGNLWPYGIAPKERNENAENRVRVPRRDEPLGVAQAVLHLPLRRRGEALLRARRGRVRMAHRLRRRRGRGERVGSLSEIDDARAPPHALGHFEPSSMRRGLLHSGEAGSDAASRDASLLSARRSAPSGIELSRPSPIEGRYGGL